MLCYKCGQPAEFTIEDGSAICDQCEEDFQHWMSEVYPYGQCWQCGAQYREIDCSNGKKHIVAFHSEGGCGQWRDYGDFEPAPGYCAYGCHPPQPLALVDEHGVDIPF